MADSEGGGVVSGAASGAAAGSAFGPWGTVIGAGIGAIGSYMGQSSANSANIKQAEMQMAFQRDMDNTKYQRSVRDLKEAGLNPMLAYTNGVTPAPQGAKAEIRDAVGPAVNSAVQGAMVSAQVENVKANTAKQESEAAVNAATVPKLIADEQTSRATAYRETSQGALNSVNYNRTLAEIPLIAAREGLTVAETQLVRENVKNAFLTGQKIKAETDNVKVNNVLLKLEIPEASNKAKHHEKYQWYNQNVSPFSKDMGTITHSAANVKRMIR